VTKRSIIALVFALVVVLHLLAITDRWTPKQDSALYMVLGRSLAEGRGMEFAGRQYWGIPPFVPLLIAGNHLLVGPSVWPLNVAMTAFAIGTVGIAYALVRRLAAELPATYQIDLPLGALIVVGTSARLYIDGTYVLTDVPFAFWVMLGLYGFVRGRRGHWGWCLAGSLALAVGVYTRLPAPAILAGAVAAVLVDVRRPGGGRRVAAALGGAAVVLASAAVWLLVVSARRDANTVDYVSSLALERFLTWEGVREAAGTVAEFPAAITSAIVNQKLEFAHFNLLPTALVILGLATSARHRQWLVVLPLGAYVLLLAVRGGGSAASRYMLPMMPILAYALLLGVQTLANWATRLGRTLGVPDSPTTAFLNRVPLAVAVALLTATSLVRVGRQIIWVHHPRFEEVYEDGRWQDPLAVGRYLKGRAERPQDTVLTPDDTIVAYVSGLWTEDRIRWRGRGYVHWSEAPPEAVVHEAERRGYRFVVVPTDKGDWSRGVEARLAENELFRGPLRPFDTLAVYERAAEAEATEGPGRP
jgi:4-amino-4-deoxy-L-arabinose transferase-like glycosyltransferase